MYKLMKENEMYVEAISQNVCTRTDTREQCERLSTHTNRRKKWPDGPCTVVVTKPKRCTFHRGIYIQQISTRVFIERTPNA